MAVTKIKLTQLANSTTPGSVLGTDSSNNVVHVAPTTGADRIVFYDDSATALAFLTLGTNLSITGTTLNASAGAGGYSNIQEEGSGITARSTLNFIGAGFTAADDAPNSRTNITLDATLNSLAGFNTNGLMVQTAADTFTGRTLTGTASRITITNGDGVSGNPTVDIDAAYVGQATITTLGTVTTGTWSATTIAANKGGTGQTTYAVGDLLSANTTSTLTKIAAVASGSVLKSAGTNTLPVWGTLASTDLTNSSNIALLNAAQTFSNTITFGVVPQFAGTPSAGNDLTNVTYVTTAIGNAVAGIKRDSVRVATTAILTATAQTATTITLGGTTLTIDSISLANGDTLLVKDSVTGGSGGTFNNGVYTVGGIGSSVVLTRVSWMDAASEIDGVYVAVEDGTTNAGTLWITVSEVTTLGTDAITFTRIQTSGTVTSVATTAPAAGITISGSPITTSGTFTFALANDLAAVEGLATNGIATRTATDTWTTRTMTGTSNRITITNGDGVSGNPTFDIAATYVGQTSITTLGTIATGTWNGTAIGPTFGGTGQTTVAVGDILLGTGVNTWGKLAIGSSGTVLKSNGTTASWGSAIAGTRAYLTGSTSSVIDLDSGTAVTDVDGNNIAFTVPTDLDLVVVVRNGVVLSRSGTVSRDYTLVSATGVLTLASALTADESLMVIKLG